MNVDIWEYRRREYKKKFKALISRKNLKISESRISVKEKKDMQMKLDVIM